MDPFLPLAHGIRQCEYGMRKLVSILNPSVKNGVKKTFLLFTGGEVQQHKGQSYYVTSVCFSPDGSLLASGSYDKTVRVWNAQTGEYIEPKCQKWSKKDFSIVYRW